MNFAAQEFNLIAKLIILIEQSLNIPVFFCKEHCHSGRCVVGFVCALSNLRLDDTLLYQHLSNMRLGKNGTGQTGYAYQVLDFDIVALRL